MKTLITSGDSFSECTSGFVDTWPVHLKNWLGIDHITKAVEGQSNGLIAKSIVYEIHQQLSAGLDPSKIIVGVMWSASSRWEFYDQDRVYDFKTSIPEIWKNPTNFNSEETGGWYYLNIQHDSQYAKDFYKNYFTSTAGMIKTLESILYVQWFLRNYNVKYFMCHWEPKLFDLSYKDIPATKHLWEMIDWNCFVSFESQLEWLSKIKGNHVLSRHPHSDEHKKYCEDIILPHVQKML